MSSSSSEPYKDDEAPRANPFVAKLFDMLSDPENHEHCGFSADGANLIVHNPTIFAELLLPRVRCSRSRRIPRDVIL